MRHPAGAVSAAIAQTAWSVWMSVSGKWNLAVLCVMSAGIMMAKELITGRSSAAVIKSRNYMQSGSGQSLRL